MDLRIFIQQRFVAAVHESKVIVGIGVDAPAVYPEFFRAPDGILDEVIGK